MVRIKQNVTQNNKKIFDKKLIFNMNKKLVRQVPENDNKSLNDKNTIKKDVTIDHLDGEKKKRPILLNRLNQRLKNHTDTSLAQLL